MAAGNVIVDGVAASNFIAEENGLLSLDAAAAERIKFLVRWHLMWLGTTLPATCCSVTT